MAHVKVGAEGAAAVTRRLNRGTGADSPFPSNIISAAPFDWPPTRDHPRRLGS